MACKRREGEDEFAGRNDCMTVSAASFFVFAQAACLFRASPMYASGLRNSLRKSFGRTGNIRHSFEDRECCAPVVVGNPALFCGGVLGHSVAVPTPGALLSVSLQQIWFVLLYSPGFAHDQVYE